MPTGTLGIVVSGIKLVGQITLETQSFIKQADKLFYLVSDGITAQWLAQLNPTAESLFVIVRLTQRVI